MTYNIGKKTLSANVGIGYIVQCNYNDDFGIVYGNRMDNNGTTLTNNCYINLLWFKKKRETVYKPFTIVSYLQETFNNPTFEIFQISSLKTIPILFIGKNQKIIFKEGIGTYFESEWQMMNKALPFLTMEDNLESTIRIPYIQNDKHIVEYYSYRIINSVDTLIGCFCLYNRFKDLNTKTITTKIMDTINYLNKFNIKEEIKKFYYRKYGYFKYRPGRDDYFFMIEGEFTKSTDEYILQLVDLKEKHDYYTCVGRGKDDNDYDYIDNEKTTLLQEKVLTKYSKNKHYIFFMKKYTNLFEEYLELSYKAKQNLYSFINKKNSYLFSNKIHKEKLISEINKFNHSCQKIDDL